MLTDNAKSPINTKEVEALIAEIGKTAIGESTESLAMVLSKSAAMILELLEERDAWKAFAEHQTWCADCSESIGSCPIGSRLQEAALKSKEPR